MVFGHLIGHCVGHAIGHAIRDSRRQTQQAPAIIVQQTNTQPIPPPGTGYLPGYQPFTNQPTTVVIGPQPAVMQVSNIKPDSYMVIAILATVFCFFPFGIPGIVYASRVDPAYESGDYLVAHSSSLSARSWTIAACITGSVIYCLLAVYIFLVVVNTNNYDDY